MLGPGKDQEFTNLKDLMPPGQSKIQAPIETASAAYHNMQPGLFPITLTVARTELKHPVVSTNASLDIARQQIARYVTDNYHRTKSGGFDAKSDFGGVFMATVHPQTGEITVWNFVYEHANPPTFITDYEGKNVIDPSKINAREYLLVSPDGTFDVKDPTMHTLTSPRANMRMTPAEFSELHLLQKVPAPPSV